MSEHIYAPPTLLTVAELAMALRVAESTVYYWVSRKEIPFVKCGRHLRFELRKVLQTFEDRIGAKACSPPLPVVMRSISSLKTRNVGQADPKED